MEVVTLKERTHRGYWWGKRLDVPEGRVWSLPRPWRPLLICLVSNPVTPSYLINLGKETLAPHICERK